VIVFDLFAGTGSATKAFEDRGHTVIRVELIAKYNAHEKDVLTLNSKNLIEKYGHPDFIWASPPCTTFSVASCPIYWHYVEGVLTPKDDRVYHGIAMVKKAISLIDEIKPKLGRII
jgi:site-specific DNA-cytosine methylase